MTKFKTDKLKDIKNFRELGGLTNKGGEVFKVRSLFRSGHLADRTADGSTFLSDLDIATVIDFRSDAEKMRHKVFFDEYWSPDYIPLPIGGNAAAWVQRLMEEVKSSAFPATALHNQFILAFQTIPIQNADGLAQFFCTIKNAKPGAILFHCSAGKDRTGIAAALLMKILDFDGAKIYENFMATNEAIDLPKAAKEMTDNIKEKLGISVLPEAVLPLVGVKESFLDALFASIKKEYAGFEDYRKQALKVTDTDKETLKSRFLIS